MEINKRFSPDAHKDGNEHQRLEYTPYGEIWVDKTSNTGLQYLPYKFTGKEMDEETGLYYYGARYLDPKYSRWLSTDPALGDYIPQAPISDEARRNNSNLPGMGGVFNHINANLYHYSANNPVKYTDPDGNFDLPYMSPREFFNFLLEHDSGAKTAKLYADAVNGDKNAQAMAKDVTIEAGKEMAKNTAEAGKKIAVVTLEGVESTADIVSEVSGDIALIGFATAQPEVAGPFGTISEGATYVGCGAAGLKAAITGDDKDINHFIIAVQLT